MDALTGILYSLEHAKNCLRESVAPVHVTTPEIMAASLACATQGKTIGQPRESNERDERNNWWKTFNRSGRQNQQHAPNRQWQQLGMRGTLSWAKFKSTGATKRTAVYAVNRPSITCKAKVPSARTNVSSRPETSPKKKTSEKTISYHTLGKMCSRAHCVPKWSVSRLRLSVAATLILKTSSPNQARQMSHSCPKEKARKKKNDGFSFHDALLA